MFVSGGHVEAMNPDGYQMIQIDAFIFFILSS